MGIVLDGLKAIDVESNVVLKSSTRWEQIEPWYYEIGFPDGPEVFYFPIGKKKRWISYEDENDKPRTEIVTYALCIGHTDAQTLIHKIGEDRLARSQFNAKNFIEFIEKALFVLGTRNGEKLDIIPEFKVEWVEKVTPELCRQWRAPETPPE